MLAKLLYGIATAISAIGLFLRFEMEENANFWGYMLWVAVIPAFAGLIALGLKWLLIALTFIFHTVLAGFVWLLLLVKIAYEIFHMLSTADHLQEIDEKIRKAR
ncbi:MAG: hypothetical protein ACRESZ_22055 [Methylococcales bacterium]